MKIAIIGAGLGGLACALECERLGIIPDVFERDESVGWPWTCIVHWLNILERDKGEIRNFLREKYNLDIRPISELKELIMVSPHKKAEIHGKLGYIMRRGKHVESVENQLYRTLKRTPVHFNRFADYKELSPKYDYVVVANGKDTVAKELGVWKEFGAVHIRGGAAFGAFNPNSTTVYFNFRYAGSGFARLGPINSNQAVVGMCQIGEGEYDTDVLFKDFLEYEGLEDLEFYYKFSLPVFSTGKVDKFKIDNVLLVGRAAGLTERLLGTGAVEALVSGVFAARSMIKGMDYDSLVKPLQDHVENLSAFRKPLESLDNNGLDRLMSVIGAPGIKQIIYNTNINFPDLIGPIQQQVNKIRGKRGCRPSDGKKRFHPALKQGENPPGPPP